MNRKISILALGFIICMSSISAQALGGRSDGGGNAVVCLNSTGNIQSAEVYDLYEGRVLNGWTAAPSSEPLLDQAKNAAWKIAEASAGGILPDKVRRLYQQLHILPKGVGLKPIHDASHIAVPKDCSIMQLASYQDNSDDIYVDGDIWEKLDDQNKSALLLHEALYWLLRTRTGEVSSDHTRRGVAAAYAKIAFVPVNDDLPPRKNQERCRVLTPNQSIHWSTFYTFLNPVTQKLTFQFLSLENKMMLSKSLAVFSHLKTWPLSQAASVDIGFSNLESTVESNRNISIEILAHGSAVTGYIQLSGNSQAMPFVCEVY